MIVWDVIASPIELIFFSLFVHIFFSRVSALFFTFFFLMPDGNLLVFDFMFCFLYCCSSYFIWLGYCCVIRTRFADSRRQVFICFPLLIKDCFWLDFFFQQQICFLPLFLCIVPFFPCQAGILVVFYFCFLFYTAVVPIFFFGFAVVALFILLLSCLG